MTEEIPHIPVLFDETIDAFKDCNDGYIIDCTLGYGGHSLGLLEKYPNIKLICNDQDDTALEFSKKRLSKYKDRIIFNKGNFQTVVEKFKDENIVGILADIGVSSLQLDQSNRGFGFESDVLDMRMDQGQSLSAIDVVNNYDQNRLEYIFKEYGEVREYKKAASLVIQKRPFTSAKDLAHMFSKNLFKSKLHPATLPFQAIRIEVNDELEVIEALLDKSSQYLKKGGRLVCISYHSLEDRLVKKFIQNGGFRKEASSDLYGNKRLNLVKVGKMITPSKNEILINNRSRSAKLRIAERI